MVIICIQATVPRMKKYGLDPVLVTRDRGRQVGPGENRHKLLMWLQIDNAVSCRNYVTFGDDATTAKMKAKQTQWNLVRIDFDFCVLTSQNTEYALFSEWLWENLK